MKRLDARNVFRRPAPAGDIEADMPERGNRVRAQFAKPHHADMDVARRGLRMLEPYSLALLLSVNPLAAVEH